MDLRTCVHILGMTEIKTETINAHYIFSSGRVLNALLMLHTCTHVIQLSTILTDTLALMSGYSEAL